MELDGDLDVAQVYAKSVSPDEVATIARAVDLYLPDKQVDLRVWVRQRFHESPDCPGWWAIVVDLGSYTADLLRDHALADALEEAVHSSVDVVVHGRGATDGEIWSGRICSPMACVPVGVHVYPDGAQIWRSGQGRGPVGAR